MRPLKLALVLSLLAATGAFVGLRLRESATAIDGGTVRANIDELAFAVVLVMGATFALALTWSVLVHALDAGAGSRRRLLATFAYTWIARYVPGTVPALAGRVYAASSAGYGTRPLIVATGLQSALEVVVATAYGLAMLTFARRGMADAVAWLVAGALVVALIAATRASTLTRIARTGRRLLRRSQSEAVESGLPSSGVMVIATGGIGVCQALVTASLCVTIVAVEPLGAGDIPHIAAAASLSGVLGMLIVLAPAGLGVRDAAMLAMLAPIMPVESATVAVVLFRGVTIVADVFTAGAAFAWDRAAEARSTPREVAAAVETMSLERRS